MLLSSFDLVKTIFLIGLAKQAASQLPNNRRQDFLELRKYGIKVETITMHTHFSVFAPLDWNCVMISVEVNPAFHIKRETKGEMTVNSVCCKYLHDSKRSLCYMHGIDFRSITHDNCEVGWDGGSKYVTLTEQDHSYGRQSNYLFKC